MCVCVGVEIQENYSREETEYYINVIFRGKSLGLVWHYSGTSNLQHHARAIERDFFRDNSLCTENTHQTSKVVSKLTPCI